MSRAIRLAELLALDPAAYPEAAMYEVLGLLGRGAMGQVLLARDTKLGREVAIKLMSVDEDNADEGRERFYREAKALAALEHGAIVRVVSFSGADCPRPFLVTERLRGNDLDSLIAEAQLSEAEAAAVGYEVAQGLAHAHAHGIVHRDVKPANIMVEEAGRVVLLDFGLAKGIRTDGSGTFVASQTKLVGTREFTSPEQCTDSAPVSAASDLFSLGAVLYYASTQVLPFRGESALEMTRALVNEPHLPLSSLIDCSAEFQAIVDRLLAKAPSERFTSGEALAKALRDVLRAHGISHPMDVLQTLGARQRARVDEVTQVSSLHDVRAALAATVPENTVVTPRSRVVTKPLLRPHFAPTAKLGPDAGTPAGRSVRLWLVAGLTLIVIVAALVALIADKGALALRFLGARPAVTPAEDHAPVATAERELPAALATATVRLGVKPWGEISVDGEARGRTPALRLLSLPLGAHDIEVRHPTLGTRKQHIVLRVAGEELLVKLDLTQPAPADAPH